MYGWDGLWLEPRDPFYLLICSVSGREIPRMLDSEGFSFTTDYFVNRLGQTNDTVRITMVFSYNLSINWISDFITLKRGGE